MCEYTNDMNYEDQKNYTLMLKQIAAWQLPKLDQKSPIVAALPSLQRGAVWKPNQVEMLWDSILRGFPIGALVVSKKLQHQASRRGANANTSQPLQEDRITHHLLDGQQRCNAITLGFLDPTLDLEGAAAGLWLDLKPEFAKNSSRSFMVRLCTKAHPWGYTKDDKVGRLSAGIVRNELKNTYKRNNPSHENYTRPQPSEIWPLQANVPIPMAWLLEAAESSATEAELWEKINSRCEEKKCPWEEKVINLLKQPPNHYLSNLAKALLRVKKMYLVALSVPDYALHEETQQEKNLNSQGTLQNKEERIASVEHLFYRLNGLGTELRGDELLYSMVKSYWPGIEKTIDQITPRPPATQVALLGAKLALSKLDEPPKSAPNLSVTTLRAIALSKKALDDKKSEEQEANKNAIESLFSINLKNQQKQSTISNVIKRVDEWLLYHPENNQNGLPPVLRSRMAEQAPEVFHFLMSLAKVSLDKGCNPTEPVLTRLRGLSTAVHWFGHDRDAVVKKLWSMGDLEGWLNGSVYSTHRGVLTLLKAIGEESEQKKLGLLNLLTPKDLADLITETKQETVENWHWWNTLICNPSKDDNGNFSKDKQDNLQNQYWPMLERLKNSEYLLIYAQRQWMCKKFPSYDPSITGYWDEHNRPWDYDHLLPQVNFKDVRGAKYLQVCQQWGNTIGNLHILPFEENRSRQDDSADNLPDAYVKTALLDTSSDNDLRKAFSINRDNVRGKKSDDAQAVNDFIIATRARLLRMYGDWFHSMKINSLL